MQTIKNLIFMTYYTNTLLCLHLIIPDLKDMCDLVMLIKYAPKIESELLISRVSRSYSYFILFFLTKSYFVLFCGKCPILPYFLAILPLILVFFIVFLSPLFHARTFLKIFQPPFAWHQYTFCPYHNKIINLLEFK